MTWDYLPWHFCGFVNFIYYKTFGQWIFMCASFFPGRVWVQPSLPRFNTVSGNGSNIQMFAKQLMEGGRRKISFLSLSTSTACLRTQVLLLDLTFPKQVKPSWYSIPHQLNLVVLFCWELSSWSNFAAHHDLFCKNLCNIQRLKQSLPPHSPVTLCSFLYSGINSL